MESIQKSPSRLQPNTNMQTARSLIRKANANNGPISLEKNEIIRGLVTDLRQGFVKLKLVNRQTVTATLEGSNEVSIGDVAAFKITENEGGSLTLKKLNTNVSAEDATIIKALEEAELPVNEVNHTIVKELLYHKLPINKEMINKILTKTEQFPNADIDTIVYLTKKGVDFDESYLSNFDEYKSFDHRLMQHIDQIGSELDILLKTAAVREGQANFLTLTNAVFDFLDIEPVDLTTLLGEELTPPEPVDELIEGISEEMTAEEPLTNVNQTNEKDLLLSLTGRESKQLAKLFSSVELPEDYMQALKDNNVSLRETVKHITETISHLSTTAPEEIAAFKNPLVLRIFDEFHNFQASNEELASILTTGERQELLNSISDLPLDIKDAAMIANGEMTQGEFTSLIAAYISPENEAAIRSLVGKQGFTKLLGKAMEKVFSLTPQQLSDNPNSVTEFYNSLVDKMDDLQKAAGMTNQELNNPHLASKMDGLKQNLDFMQDFNKLFTYIQLPVKLQEQVTHGDLYVYTNKKKLQSGTKDVSVLLHLDMDHLGPLDIHLSLTANNVHGKFYVNDKDTKNMLQKHSGNLSKALFEKGFTMTSEFYEQQKEVDIIKDIVDKEASPAPIKRYSFDLRA